MTKKHAAKRKFNKKAPPPVAPAPIPGYAEAAPEFRAELDRALRSIDGDPRNPENIAAFGRKATESLGNIGTGMIRLRGELANHASETKQIFGTIEAGISGIDLAGFGQDLMKVMRVAGRRVLSPSEMKLLDQVEDKLPKKVTDPLALVRKLEATAKELQKDLGDADILGLARNEAARHLALFLGAGKEVLRRYDEKYIPEAEKQPGPDAAPRLADIKQRRQDFAARILVLEGSAEAAVVAGQQIALMAQKLDENLKQVRQALSEQEDWKAKLAAANKSPAEKAAQPPPAPKPPAP